MSKLTKLENLRKMVGDLERKIKTLEAQKELYLLKIESLEERLDETSDDKENE